ncbi:MAG: S41 family peptidase [Bacteroidota bacterium]
MKILYSFFMVCLLWAPIAQHAGSQPLSPLVTDGVLSSDAHGIWESPSYGWTAKITADEIVLYHTDSQGCMIDPAQTEDLLRLVTYYDRRDDLLFISPRPEGSTVYIFEPAPAIPPQCFTTPDSSPTGVFNYFWNLMNEHYAFFDLYEVDWAERRTRYADSVHYDMSDAALFDVLSSMMAGLNDGHLTLTAEIDGDEVDFDGSRPRVLAPALLAAFAAQDAVEERSAFFNQWFNGSLNRFQTRVLNSRGQGQAANGSMNWGSINNIGYISLFGMGDFAESEGDFANEIAAVHTAMDRALTDLKDTDGLIFDIALNQGGLDEVSLAIAGHFTDQPIAAYTKEGFESAHPPQTLHVQPGGTVKYLKPVSLFTSDLSVSAAEIFTLAMRALPNVTHRGDATWGALSDILSKTLPNGWELNLSNEIYTDKDGIVWEGKGIAPVDQYTVFDPENIFQSHHNAILQVAAKMRAASRRGS